ncbi:major facilitator superfamily macrolide-efflux protein [Niallia circulans]|uniref:MFS transporter n=1 Tax=Shouchella clausii TaxID=79880 RepID=UPI000BA525BF|nr:MFS transporter [Shouchella clausii]MCM3547911.1 MFS transporter [Shouchella clausii]PAF15373.1 MFS transporter [Shouchella clausii]SPU18147.1 major facilitator superfamily macrolide-efflux protein [Niallia circulans]
MSKKSEIIRILKENRNYRHLLLTTTISGLATWGAFIAMLMLLSEITETGVQLGALWALSGIVPLFMSFGLGGIIDRFHTRTVLIVSEWVRAPLHALFILVPFFDGWLAWTLFFIVRFVIGVFNSLNAVARQTIIPEIIKGDDLIVANSLNFTLTSTIRLIGAATGGTVITLIDPNYFWVLASIAFVISALLNSRIQVKDEKLKPKERHFIKELKVGFTIAKNKVFIRYVLLFALTGGLIIGSFNLMLQQMAVITYDMPAIGLSLLYIAEGATSVALGIWIANRKFMFAKIHTYGWIYILMGATWALFGFTQTIYQGIFVIFLFAAVGGFVVPFERMVMQTHVEANARGRIFGLWNTCSMLSINIGALITGIVIDYVGLAYVPLIVAILEIILGIVFFIQFRGRSTDEAKKLGEVG